MLIISKCSYLFSNLIFFFQDPMEIVIKVVYEECTKQKNLEHRIKLGYPLVANQQLWKKCTVFSQNEPTEQECIESLDQISLE